MANEASCSTGAGGDDVGESSQPEEAPDAASAERVPATAPGVALPAAPASQGASNAAPAVANATSGGGSVAPSFAVSAAMQQQEEEVVAHSSHPQPPHPMAQAAQAAAMNQALSAVSQAAGQRAGGAVAASMALPPGYSPGAMMPAGVPAAAAVHGVGVPAGLTPQQHAQLLYQQSLQQQQHLLQQAQARVHAGYLSPQALIQQHQQHLPQAQQPQPQAPQQLQLPLPHQHQAPRSGSPPTGLMPQGSATGLDPWFLEGHIESLRRAAYYVQFLPRSQQDMLIPVLNHVWAHISKFCEHADGAFRAHVAAVRDPDAHRGGNAASSTGGSGGGAFGGNGNGAGVGLDVTSGIGNGNGHGGSPGSSGVLARAGSIAALHGGLPSAAMLGSSVVLSAGPEPTSAHFRVRIHTPYSGTKLIAGEIKYRVGKDRTPFRPLVEVDPVIAPRVRQLTASIVAPSSTEAIPGALFRAEDLARSKAGHREAKPVTPVSQVEAVRISDTEFKFQLIVVPTCKKYRCQHFLLRVDAYVDSFSGPGHLTVYSDPWVAVSGNLGPGNNALVQGVAARSAFSPQDASASVSAAAASAAAATGAALRDAPSSPSRSGDDASPHGPAKRPRLSPP